MQKLKNQAVWFFLPVLILVIGQGGEQLWVLLEAVEVYSSPVVLHEGASHLPAKLVSQQKHMLNNGLHN